MRSNHNNLLLSPVSKNKFINYGFLSSIFYFFLTKHCCKFQKERYWDANLPGFMNFEVFWNRRMHNRKRKEVFQISLSFLKSHFHLFLQSSSCMKPSLSSCLPTSWELFFFSSFLVVPSLVSAFSSFPFAKYGQTISFLLYPKRCHQL